MQGRQPGMPHLCLPCSSPAGHASPVPAVFVSSQVAAHAVRAGARGATPAAGSGGGPKGAISRKRTRRAGCDRASGSMPRGASGIKAEQGAERTGRARSLRLLSIRQSEGQGEVQQPPPPNLAGGALLCVEPCSGSIALHCFLDTQPGRWKEARETVGHHRRGATAATANDFLYGRLVLASSDLIEKLQQGFFNNDPLPFFVRIDIFIVEFFFGNKLFSNTDDVLEQSSSALVRD